MNLELELKGKPTDFFKNRTMRALIEANCGGHKLGAWERTEQGWRARCMVCTMPVVIGDGGQYYTLLANKCPGAKRE